MALFVLVVCTHRCYQASEVDVVGVTVQIIWPLVNLRQLARS